MDCNYKISKNIHKKVKDWGLYLFPQKCFPNMSSKNIFFECQKFWKKLESGQLNQSLFDKIFYFLKILQKRIYVIAKRRETSPKLQRAFKLFGVLHYHNCTIKSIQFWSHEISTTVGQKSIYTCIFQVPKIVARNYRSQLYIITRNYVVIRHRNVHYKNNDSQYFFSIRALVNSCKLWSLRNEANRGHYWQKKMFGIFSVSYFAPTRFSHFYSLVAPRTLMRHKIFASSSKLRKKIETCNYFTLFK